MKKEKQASSSLTGPASIGWRATLPWRASGPGTSRPKRSKTIRTGPCKNAPYPPAGTFCRQIACSGLLHHPLHFPVASRILWIQRIRGAPPSRGAALPDTSRPASELSPGRRNRHRRGGEGRRGQTRASSSAPALLLDPPRAHRRPAVPLLLRALSAREGASEETEDVPEAGPPRLVVVQHPGRPRARRASARRRRIRGLPRT
jgi:hypothetical protein